VESERQRVDCDPLRGCASLPASADCLAPHQAAWPLAGSGSANDLAKPAGRAGSRGEIGQADPAHVVALTK